MSNIQNSFLILVSTFTPQPVNHMFFSKRQWLVCFKHCVVWMVCYHYCEYDLLSVVSAGTCDWLPLSGSERRRGHSGLRSRHEMWSDQRSAGQHHRDPPYLCGGAFLWPTASLSLTCPVLSLSITCSSLHLFPDIHHHGGHQELRRRHHSVRLLRLNPARLTGCQD